jgi:hypothetical protein
MSTDENLNERLGQGQDDHKDLSPLTIKPLPGAFRFMPDIIKKIHEIGGQVRMEPDGTITVDGFYKNGPINLEFDDKGRVSAVDKRGRKTVIKSVDDLVTLNFTWWKISMGKGKSTYIVPERPWLDKFIEKKWVRRKLIFEPIDESCPPEEE